MTAAAEGSPHGVTKIIMAPLLRLGLSALLLYGLILIFLYFYQERLLFLPGIGGRELIATPAAAGLAFEEVVLHSSRDILIHGWYLPGPAGRPERATLLFLHGNAGNISHRLDSLKIFNRLGLAVLIIDYQGYGKSGGRPSEANTHADGAAAYRYLVEKRGVAPQRLVLFGRSLGAAVAARLATEQATGALIVESGFTSVPDLGSDLYPWLPVRLLSRLDYDVRASLAKVSCPVLVIHSRDDEIIPFRHGEALFAAARPPREFLAISGGHNDGFLRSGRLYVNGLEGFLDRHLALFPFPEIKGPGKY